MPITKFKPPTVRKILHEEKPERLRRVEKVCSKIYQSYVYNRTTDRKELEFSLYAQKYPDNIRITLKTLARVRLVAPNQFEVNEECDTQKKFDVRECLVYTVLKECMDPRNPETNVLSYYISKIGVYSAPLGIVEFDDLGNPIPEKSRVTNWVNRFWIPFSKQNVEAVIKEHGNYRNLVLGEAAVSGDSYHAGNTLTVWNLQEFLETDYETLKSANLGNFLKQEYGGTVQYLKDQAKKRKQLEAELKEFEGMERSNEEKNRWQQGQAIKVT